MLFLEMSWIAIQGFFDAGGNVLWAIFATTGLMWSMIIERLWFFRNAHAVNIEHAEVQWAMQEDHSTWYSQAIRRQLISCVSLEAHRYIRLIQVLMAILPLLGVKLDHQLFTDIRWKVAAFWNRLEHPFHFLGVHVHPLWKSVYGEPCIEAPGADEFRTLLDGWGIAADVEAMDSLTPRPFQDATAALNRAAGRLHVKKNSPEFEKLRAAVDDALIEDANGNLRFNWDFQSVPYVFSWRTDT